MYIHVTGYALPKIQAFLIDQECTFGILRMMVVDQFYVMFLRHEKLQKTSN